MYSIYINTTQDFDIAEICQLLDVQEDGMDVSYNEVLNIIMITAYAEFYILTHLILDFRN